MQAELERKLVERWPSWFHIDGDPRQTAMTRGFQHDDGWFGIVWQLCEDLEPLASAAEREIGVPFEALQVKEKFGTLRFYVNHQTEGAATGVERFAQDPLQ